MTQLSDRRDSLADTLVAPEVGSALRPVADSVMAELPDAPEVSVAAAGAPDNVSAAALSDDGYTLWYRKIVDQMPEGPSFPVVSIPYREASAREVFGEHSCSVAPLVEPVPLREPLCGEPGFQGFVLLLAAAYVLLLSRHWQDVMLLAGPLMRRRVSSERLVDEPLESNVGRLRRLSFVLGLFIIGMVAVRCADLLLPARILEPLPGGPGAVLWGGVVVVVLVGCYQWGLLSLVGAVTLTRPLIGRLQQLRREFFVITVLLLAPVLLFFVLSASHSGLLWGALAIVVSVITSFLYLIGSFNLFLAKKISILYWFLYLCAVELFPLSLLWLLVQGAC